MKKYGSPIVVLNLMKRTEEKGRRDRRREGVLSDEFRRQVATQTDSPYFVFNFTQIYLHITKLIYIILSKSFLKVEYLNQFLPEEHAIEYISFDMAKCKKR